MVRLASFLAFASMGMLVYGMSTQFTKRSITDVQGCLKDLNEVAHEMCDKLRKYDGSSGQAQEIYDLGVKVLKETQECEIIVEVQPPFSQTDDKTLVEIVDEVTRSLKCILEELVRQKEKLEKALPGAKQDIIDFLNEWEAKAIDLASRLRDHAADGDKEAATKLVKEIESLFKQAEHDAK